MPQKFFRNSVIDGGSENLLNWHASEFQEFRFSGFQNFSDRWCFEILETCRYDMPRISVFRNSDFQWQMMGVKTCRTDWLQDFRFSVFQDFSPHLRVLHHEALVKQTTVAVGGWQAMGVKTCRSDRAPDFQDFRIFRFSGFLRMHPSGHLGVGGEPVSEGGKTAPTRAQSGRQGRFRRVGRRRAWGGQARRHGRLWWDFALQPVRQTAMGNKWIVGRWSAPIVPNYHVDVGLLILCNRRRVFAYAVFLLGKSWVDGKKFFPLRFYSWRAFTNESLVT